MQLADTMRTIYLLRYSPIFSILVGWLMMGLTAQAQLSITTAATAVTQTFDALPVASSATFGQNTTILGVYAERTGSGTTIVANDGSAATGNLYSYGTGIDKDRALGSIGSGTSTAGDFAYGLRLKNNTGTTITSLVISYVGEQWRNSGAAAQTINFSYRISSAPITTLSVATSLPVPPGYTGVPALDFTSPVSGTAVAIGALNGNAAVNRTTKTATITSLSVAPGAEIMLRWYDADQPGDDHGLAIDDVSVTVLTNTSAAGETLTVTPTSFSNLTTTVGTTSAPVAYSLTGRQLTSRVTVSATAGVEISNDPNGSIYTPTISITPTAGTVDATIRVRLTGAAPGSVSAVITQSTSTTTGSLVASISVTGTVVGASLATIAVARSRPDGTSTATLPGGKLAGRVTVSSQFGGKLFYMQDATGGISVFNSTTAVGTLLQLGDSIQVAGTINTYQGARELDLTSYTVVAGTPRIPSPEIIRASQLPAYEGRLVSVQSTTIGGAGTAFAATTYPITAISGTGTLFVNDASELNGASKPSGGGTVTGIVDRMVSTTVNSTVLMPRLLTDVSGATSLDQVCGGTGGSALPASQTFDISTWSLNFFGADAGTITCSSPPVSRPYNNQGPVDDDKQARNVKTILQKLNADIVVNEDVSDETRYAAVVRSLPGSYSYVCSDKFSNYFLDQCDLPINSDGTVLGPTKYAQKVCVLYNKATVTPILAESRALLTTAYSYPASNSWESGRLPYLFVANVTINGLVRKIHVVGIQAKSGTSIADYNRRKSDLDTLKAELDRTYPTANIIILGNYNDQITSSTTAGRPSSYSAFSADAARYQVVTRLLETTGCVTFTPAASFVDHIIIANELVPAYVGNSAAVLLPATGIEGPYALTTSDHNPVSARFNLSALPGPAAPLAVTLTVSPTTATGTASLSAIVVGGTPPYSYTFSGPGIITLNGNAATVTNLTATSPSSFTVRVADATGQVAIATTGKSLTGTTGGITADSANNVFAGRGAGFSNTTGFGNVGLGPGALYKNQTSRNNVAIGDSAGYQNTASANIFLGAKAGFSNTTATQATFVGDSAGFYSNGQANTFVGYKAGLNTTTGNNNTFMGVQAGLNTTTGSSNFMVGTNAGMNNTTGSYNLFLGEDAGAANTTGRSNIYLGVDAANGPGVNGSNNVSIGFGSGRGNLSGATNTFVGYQADAGAINLTNATALGANARVTVSNALVLGSNANVGIGTTAPTAKLEITSGVGGSSGLKLTNLTSASPANVNARKFLTVDATGMLVLANYANSGRLSATDTTASLWQLNGQIIQSTGDNAVVIGNTVARTPVGYRLFVEEGILTEKVKVAIKNSADWSDHVFSSGYRLRPLTEVENYIKSHRHLPGVPSADDVVKEGIDVGKMDAKLLEKVEETMLYLMQVNKRLERLEKENRRLKTENRQIKRQLHQQRH